MLVDWPHVPIRCCRANLLPGPPLPVLPAADGVSLSAKDWTWAIAALGIRPLLDADGLPWREELDPTRNGLLDFGYSTTEVFRTFVFPRWSLFEHRCMLQCGHAGDHVFESIIWR